MDANRFWEIIEESRKDADGSHERQEENLRAILKKLKVPEIVGFDRIFNEMRYKAYTWDLWGAAYLVNGGCSDDGFEYFRCALIAEGRDRFESAVRDPESLADWIEEGDLEFEAFGYVVPKVYSDKAKTKEWPRHNLVTPKAPSGEPWEEDDLETRFPKLWAAFGG